MVTHQLEVEAPFAPHMYRAYASLLRKSGRTDEAANELAKAKAADEALEEAEVERCLADVTAKAGVEVGVVRDAMAKRAAGSRDVSLKARGRLSAELQVVHTLLDGRG